MRIYVLQLILLGFIVSCATMDQPKSGEPATSEEEKMEEDVIVKEITQEVTFEKQVNSLYDLAYESYLSGQYEKAIVAYESAQLLDQQKMEFWRKLALSYCLLATGRYRESEKLSLALIEEKSDYWKPYMNAGLSYLWMGKLNQAIEYLDKASEFQDAEPTVNMYLGISYHLQKKEVQAKKQFDLAEKEYREIMKNNPDDEQAFMELAYLYLYSDKNHKDVLDLVDKAKKIIEDSDNPEKKQVWTDFYLPHLKGILLYRRGDYRDSILSLTDSLEHAPSGIHIDLAEIYYYLGKNYVALKDLNRAEQFFRKAMDTDAIVLYSNDIQTFLKTRKTVKVTK